MILQVSPGYMILPDHGKVRVFGFRKVNDMLRVSMAGRVEYIDPSEVTEINGVAYSPAPTLDELYDALNAEVFTAACIAPAFTTSVAIDGDTIVGATLSVSDNGNPSGTAPITSTYQWYLNGVAIGGQTADTYEIVGPVGRPVYCRVTATNACGSVVENSNTIVIT
jgi:hypothetical protein